MIEKEHKIGSRSIAYCNKCKVFCFLRGGFFTPIEDKPRFVCGDCKKKMQTKEPDREFISVFEGLDSGSLKLTGKSE